ncbi:MULTISPECIES: alpha/beta hydrolase [Pseudomonas]|uniref:alpha/beta hydrolase n=1 Tax=Pseudomonas TaxID=286 RepID=UPI00235DDC28|nr:MULTISPECIES: alpha/beta hydrolase [Pseudomonas]WJV25631.1 alpha/beta hydrolase [Pseudomonas chlororaphis]
MTTLYRGMNRAALDAAYNNVAAIPDFPAVLADFQMRSAKLYERESCRRDLSYGDSSRERYDWIECGQPDAPTFVFIHGGYWQNCTKEDFAFIASGPLANGFNVVLAEYTLAPDASMTQIVGETGRLLDHLAADHDALGIGKRALVLSGHSAGGHLTALYRGHPVVTSALPISALVDLEPISLSWLNDKLKLSRWEIDAFSPIRHIDKGVPMAVAVGDAELPELVRHSDEYAGACAAVGETVELVHVPGCTHFSILETLALQDGSLAKALVRIAGR